MEWKSYQYSDFLDSVFQVNKVPVLEVVLHKNGKTLKQDAIIDSGAYVTMASEEVGVFFGIDKTQCQKAMVSLDSKIFTYFGVEYLHVSQEISHTAQQSYILAINVSKTGWNR